MLSKEEIRSIWPEWEIGAEIGSGSFGRVYEAVRSDHSVKSTAAIKLISIPRDEDAQDDIDFPRLGKRKSLGR